MYRGCIFALYKQATLNLTCPDTSIGFGKETDVNKKNKIFLFENAEWLKKAQRVTVNVGLIKLAISRRSHRQRSRIFRSFLCLDSNSSLAPSPNCCTNGTVLSFNVS